MKIKLITFVILSTLISCGFGQKNSHRDDNWDDEEDDIPRLTTKEYTMADSFEIGLNKASISLKIDFPQKGPKLLVDSIKAWMVESLVGPDNINLTAYLDMAKKNEPQDILKDLCRVYIDSNKEFFAEMEEGEWGTQMDEDNNILKVYQTDDFVTFKVSGYSYAGGAHEIPWDYGCTFYKTGEILGWNMFDFEPGSSKKLADMIFEGLRTQYFEGMTSSELRDFLFVSGTEFPLPSSRPFLTEKGIEFTYGPYEIGPYSAGMPSCTIPLEELKSMLNPVFFGNAGKENKFGRDN